MTLLIALHVAASTVLAAFGWHRFAMARCYRRHVHGRVSGSKRPASERRPTVTVQIPLYNERYVAERAIRAAAALRYPRHRLDIQVLDDSTDETSDRVAGVVATLRASGVAVAHVRRPDRCGFKAGALAHGLRTARGELLAVFDADFVPEPDFLERLVGEFDDPAVGVVQARWEHLNRRHSLLTRMQALQLDAHFTVEHGVRAHRGAFFNFNGTAGIWRRAAIDDAGGWQADTLTEDLDLSYRAQLRGWRFVYRDDVAAPAELPVEIAAYRQQQQRWAQGGTQAARKLLPTILGHPQLPGVVKREAAWHLLSHFAYPVLALATLAGLAAGLLADTMAARWILAADGTLLTLAMASLGYFYAAAARARSPRGWRSELAMVPVIMVIGAGIAAGQTLAVWRGLTGSRTPFRRTPKYRLSGRGDRSWRRAAYRLPAGGRGLLHIGTGVVLLAATATEASHASVLPSGMALLVSVGFVTVGAMALVQRLAPE